MIDSISWHFRPDKTSQPVLLNSLSRKDVQGKSLIEEQLDESQGMCEYALYIQAFRPDLYSEKVNLVNALWSKDDRFIQVTWNTGKKSRFPRIFLRENCKCPTCFHPVIKQRVVIIRIDENEKTVIDSISVENDGKFLECHWSDGHVSQYSSEWLHCRHLPEIQDQVQASENTSILKDGCKLVSPEQHNLSERAHEYEAIMSDDKSLLYWLYDLQSCGLSLIQNAAAKEGVLFQLAKRIGHYKPTMHGDTFSVKDSGDVNVAYTNLSLDFHTDLPMFLHPPDVQALHCIEQKTDGGTNSFLDGFKVALSLQENNPKVFNVLSTTKVPFHDNALASHDVGEFITDYSRRIIQLNEKGQLDRIYFNYWVSADFFEDINPEQVIDFYEAKAAFAGYFNSKEFIVRHKLKPGEIAIFDNNRVLHGRDSFVGQRWLEGMYFDWDPIVSKIKVINRNLGYPLPYTSHTPPHYSHK